MLLVLSGRNILTDGMLLPGMAAMLALSILLPNLNKATAHAMQSLPVIGEYFKLVTFREYRFDDGRHSADVKWNKIYADRAGTDDSGETGKQTHKSVKEINAQMEQKTEKLLKEFKKQVGALGYSSLTVDSKVVTNSSKYYCVMLSAFSSQADGYQADAFYTIEKSTGNLLELSESVPGECGLCRCTYGTDQETDAPKYEKG